MWEAGPALAWHPHTVGLPALKTANCEGIKAMSLGSLCLTWGKHVLCSMGFRAAAMFVDFHPLAACQVVLNALETQNAGDNLPFDMINHHHLK
jgi:hypothetical protein